MLLKREKDLNHRIIFSNKVQPIHVWNIGTIRVPTKSTVCEIVLDWGSIDNEYIVFLEGKKGLKKEMKIPIMVHW